MTLLNHIGLFIIATLFFITVVILNVVNGKSSFEDFYYNRVLYASFYLFALFEAFYWTVKIFFLN